MPATTACSPNCCTTIQTVNVPGSTGPSGVNGIDGINAFAIVANVIPVPAIGNTIGVTVNTSVWMVVGQVVIVGAGFGGIGGGPGHFKVTSILNDFTFNGMFLGYPGDVAPGSIIDVGAVVSPAGEQGGGWNNITKLSDQSVTNSAALVDDTTLQVYLTANLNYRIKGVVFFDTTATGDFKYGFTGPAAPTRVRFERVQGAGGAAPAEVAVDTSIPTAISLAGAGIPGFIRFDVIFKNGVNSGFFVFQFAQDTATPAESAVVLAGSYIEWNTF